MHYYQFNIGDYSSHTAHLDEIEDLAYRRMIDHYFLTEEPLPESVEEIARKIRMRTHCERIKSVLREFFTLDNGVWQHYRIDRDIAAYRLKSDKARESANARWGKKGKANNKLDDNANALRPDCEGNANHKPLTNNHKPVISDPREKIKMFDEWVPDQSLLEDKFKLAGVSSEINPALLTRFKTHYADEPKYNTEAQWIGILLSWVQKDQSNKKTTNEKDTTTFERLTDRSWADGV